MMEENEIMTTEVMEMPEVSEEKSGMNTGLAMLIGGVVTAAGLAGARKIRKVWIAHKAKKAALAASESEVIEGTAEQVSEVEETK